MDKIDFRLLNSVLEKIDRYLDKEIDVDFSETNAFLFFRQKLTPVKNFSKVNPDLLIGIDYQRDKLIKNTAKFIDGKPANHAVLWGERGTGKSSLVKSMLYIFGDKLKMIQVLKEDILNIFKLLPIIYKEKNLRFIIFIDDLSFESEEQDYKEFKTIIDGGLFDIPENLLFYVTSNKKNLIPVKFSDRDNYTRAADIIDEKLSLIDRFGLKLGFFKFDKKTYLKIVDKYADIYRIKLEKEKLYELALEYTSEAGSMNGRTALNFIKSL
ncbi:hypothetical protein SAMN06265182_1869 [Persephonella hydrogeniphila]|uniref:Uncharacterized protein n=1 Tax=Persephonella hydrogeniphila TaxID=198703 RepID=A0A285NM32_9AQUI|nr:DUF815 domain-containing protein [Persephonella hydrogeniphila]SNZ10515.1 hypothetical protein SAMN06265182_1869 [Persephonella hydrogeniphila]